MGQIPQRLLPLSVDFDTSPLYLKSEKAYFLKGIEAGWVINQGAGANGIEFKPKEGNFLYCSLAMPEGENTVIGYYYYAESNHGYVVVYNSLKNHFIYRISGADGNCQKVYDFCPDFEGITNKPKDFFSEGRITIKSLCRIRPDGSKELYTELYLVNKQVNNIRIVVEDSIATNSFTTPFFTPTYDCCGNRCRLIQIGVPTPLPPTKIIPIPPTEAEKKKQNLLLFRMIQFRFQDENAWGQVSEHGIISDQSFNNLAGCSKDSAGQPHCYWVQRKTPCPEIVKTTLLVRTCLLSKTIGTDGNLMSEWKEVTTVSLYDQTDENLKYYDRKYNLSGLDFEFVNDGKEIRIKFCNNKECKPVALANIRSQNPAPIKSGTVASISKSLAFGDNLNGLQKFPAEDIKKFSLSLTATQSCQTKYANIKVYAVVHNIIENQNNPIYSRNGKKVFGGFGQKKGFLGLGRKAKFEEKVDKPEGSLTSKGGYNQTFPLGVNGFRARLSGTNYTAESKQKEWVRGSLNDLDFSDGDIDKVRDYVGDTGANDHWAIQEFDFGMVPLGVYFFEINGHNDTENLERTSTYYIATGTFNQYNQGFSFPNNHQKRILIDISQGNSYDGMIAGDLAIIADVTHPQNFTSQGSNVVRGYLYESEENKIPIERAFIKSDAGGGGAPYYYSSEYTDHNGFYFWVDEYKFKYRVQFYGANKCQLNQYLGQTPRKEGEGSFLVSPTSVTTVLPNYATDLCNRFMVEGNISECGNGTNNSGGISGIAVILKGSAPVYTDNQGDYKVIGHFGDDRPAEPMIFSVGGCNILDCNCKPIDIIQSISQPSCTDCAENVITGGSFNFQTIVTLGAPKGSRIQIGFEGHDGIRSTAIQTNTDLFIEFPSAQEQGDNTYPRAKLTLPETFSPAFCQRYKYLTVFFSKNTNYEDFFTWAADSIDIVDAALNINSQNPRFIKIGYRSLNAYNLDRGGNTNLSWSFKDAKGDTVLGDTIEFIMTAEGKYLPTNTIGTVQYDKDGSYILVDYDDSLKDLKAGVLFKVKRPYPCEVNKTYYETVIVLNLCGQDCRPRDQYGNIIKEVFLNIFSSYTIPRQIPVVTDVIDKVGDGNGNLIDRVTQVKNIKQYPFSFEHHSPSDTWGDHCLNGGRVSFENPYEGQRCDRTQIKKSGALDQLNDGATNYLHYFDADNGYTIDEQGWGGIIAMMVRNDGQILLICDFATFSLRSNDDRAVVTADGYVRLPSSQFFSRPERNPSEDFGCQINDINTIRRMDSIVTYLDSNKQAWVVHDFSTALDLSPGIQSWLYPSIKEVQSNPDAKYWHQSFDPRSNRIYLTKFNLLDRQTENQLINLSVKSNETIYFDLTAKQWGQQVHFTPEYMGAMFGNKKDNQLFSFKDGLPWAHHNVVDPATIFLNYFGVQCFPVIGVVTNTGGTDEKSFMSNQVYCREILFILEKLETSLGQISKVYEGQWAYGEGFWSAPYLCDIQNIDPANLTIQNALIDGDTLMGRWLKALYIPSNYNGEYFTLTAIISYFIARSKGNQ